MPKIQVLCRQDLTTVASSETSLASRRSQKSRVPPPLAVAVAGGLRVMGAEWIPAHAGGMSPFLDIF